MWDTSFITNEGAAAFASWLEGTTLNLTKAAAGTGTATAEDVPELTALTEQKQLASIISATRDENNVIVKVQIPAAETAYQLNQIGLWATLDGGAEKLIAVFQDATGIPIPQITQTQEFIYSFYAILAASSTGTLTVTVTTNVTITLSTLNEALEAKQDVISAVGMLIQDADGTIRAAEAGEDYVEPDYLHIVAHTGDYDDLENKPDIPSKTSDLTNDSNFIDEDDLSDHNINQDAHQNLWIPGNYYAYSTTAAATAAKVAASANYKNHRNGCMVTVKFSKANTAATPTLKIGDTTALSIVSKGKTSLDEADWWAGGEYVIFTYDGSNWVLLQRCGNFIPLVQKGVAGGVATLAEDGKVTKTQLRPAYIEANSAPEDTGVLWVKNQVMKYYDETAGVWKNVLPVWG